MNQSKTLLPEGNDVVLLATGRNRLGTYLAEELARFNSAENRCYLSCFVADIVSRSDMPAAEQFHEAAISESQPSDFNLLGVGTVRYFTREVEPKTYAPGEMLDDPATVMRGTARIVNALARNDVRTAYEIAQRLTWPRLKRVTLSGIYGLCVKAGEEDLAKEILLALR